MIRLHNYGDVEVEAYHAHNRRPDTDGTVATVTLDLPEFDAAVFFSADQRGGKSSWPADANRELPWIVGDSFASLIEPEKPLNRSVGPPNRFGMAVLLHQRNGKALALLTLPGEKTVSVFHITDDGALSIQLMTLGTESFTGDAPLFAWAHGDTAASAFRKAWAAGLEHQAVAARSAFRWQKDYPTPFEYLGWCSWEQYKKDIDERSMVDAIRELSDTPVRWILIDDGHQEQQDRRLLSLKPDREKFPRGFAPVLGRRSNSAITWFGLWHAFQGLWNTVARPNELGDLNDCMAELPSGGYLSTGTEECARRFYDTLIGSASEAGFDFVKIDVQAANLAWYRGTENAVEASANNSRALEDAVADKLPHGMINCMAHNILCVLNTAHSAVTRCSIDYHLNDPDSSASHIMQSYTMSLLLGWSVWPDHDMFHSSDKTCGRMMAVSKALSGAPVYLSDAPADIAEPLVSPLCLSDGRLLRPLAPAVPTPDSVFLDALNDGSRPYTVIAPLANRCAAVAAYNLVQERTRLSGSIRAEVYRWSGMMTEDDEPWELPPEGLVAYRYYKSSAHRLGAHDGIPVELDQLEDDLVLLCPVSNGWSVIGRVDKYLGPAAVSEVTTGTDVLSFRLSEAGPVGIWSEAEALFSAAGRVEKRGEHFFVLDAAPAASEGIIEVRRGH